jgi:hypothetical protein
MKLLKKWDIALIAALLLIGGGWAALRFQPQKTQTVTVYVDGQVWERRTVSADTPAYTLTPPVTPAVTLAGEGGQIRFAHADCRNQLCVKAGRLGARFNAAAACLPARVAVVVEGAKAAGGLDAVTY